MKSARILATGVLFMVVLALPILVTSSASAQRITPLSCVVYYFDEQEQYQFDFVTEGCDLSIEKYVSVNGGSFFDANTSSEAVNANVGDNVIWQVIIGGSLPVAPENGGTYHVGIARVSDLLPSGVSYVSHTVDYGIFDSSTGFWDFEMNSEQPNFKIELLVNTTAVSSGLHENQARLSGYDTNLCGSEGPGPCGFQIYSDGDANNNSNSAWVSVSGTPVVLGESSTAQVQGLADTGDSIVQSLVAGALIVVTLAVAFTGRLRTKIVKTDR